MVINQHAGKLAGVIIGPWLVPSSLAHARLCAESATGAALAGELFAAMAAQRI
jgi:hypothetical protein